MADSDSSPREKRGVPSGLIKTGRILFAIVFVALIVSNLMLQRKVRQLEANLHSAALTLLRRGTLHVGEPLPAIGLRAVNGSKTTLVEVSAATPLIFFVDPECDACRALIAEAAKLPSSTAMSFIAIPRPGVSAVLRGVPPGRPIFTIAPEHEAQMRHLVGRVPRMLLAGNGQTVRLCDKLADCIDPVASAARQPL